ncbi:MAG: hypothetical protein ACE5OZ_03840 [Candidatus Heimdallarchaeota archaeon]
MSEEELNAAIEELTIRNNEQKPMKGWNRDILFLVTDLKIAYRAFFRDGIISEMKKRTNISEEEIEESHVVLEGTIDSWLAFLRGEIRPARAMLMRKIKAKKGSAREILPFTKILGK